MKSRPFPFPIRNGGSSRHWPSWSVVVLWIAITLLPAGCSRQMYRKRADKDAYRLVQQKSQNPHWALENYTIKVDPRSRLFDPTNPDHPPMPPDDPQAHKLMHRVDGKKGWPHWHDNGDTPFTENPDWLAYLPVRDDGTVELQSEEAVKTALLHSRNYQQQLEELYLSALDVSFERFRFDAQYFSGFEGFFERDYVSARTPGGVKTTAGSSTTLGLTSSAGDPLLGITKLGTTGTQMVVGLANSIVWQLAGTDSNTSVTLVDFTLLQPLLRDAGKQVVMERLTLAERTLLANVRNMERYRQGFYVQILTGRDPGQGPNRRGGVFGGAGFSDFVGVGGGFGRVTVAQISGQGLGTGAGGGQAGGYLGLLQQQQDIRNQEFNVTSLRINLNQLRETLEAVRRTGGAPGEEQQHKEQILRASLQVAQAQQALYTAEGRLLNARYDFASSLDNFKLTLGLPPQVPLEVDDPMIEPLRLLRMDLMEVNGCLKDILSDVGNTNQAIMDQETRMPGAAEREQPLLRWTPELAELLQHLKQQFALAQRLQQELLSDHIPQTQADIDRLKETVPSRAEKLQRLEERFNLSQKRPKTDEDREVCAAGVPLVIEPEVFDVDKIQQLPQELEDQQQLLQSRVESFGEPLQGLVVELEDLLESGPQLSSEDLAERVRTNVVFRAPQILRDLSSDILNLMLIQARARVHSVELAEVDLDPVAALDIARVYRHDWMNARASLVDAWRLVEFNANRLKGGLNLTIDGDITTVSNRPTHLGDRYNKNIRVGFEFDAPLTRLAERNQYRQSLIEYQQSRRSYYQFVDQISQGLRRILRTIEANQLNFEARRLAVLSAVEQIIINDAIQTEGQRDTSQATAARDSVSALTDLLNAQNDFLGVWITYEVLRRSLDYDLGTMQLDHDGLWIDPGKIDGSRASALEGLIEPAPEVLVFPDLAESLEELEEAGEAVPPGPARQEDEAGAPTPAKLNPPQDLLPPAEAP